jgi:hypothetical protein
MPQNTEIDVYSAGTPNGHKIHILLEELDLKYNLHKIEIGKNTQKEDWFLKINRTSLVSRFCTLPGGNTSFRKTTTQLS